jgi:hypothetical protein
MNLGKRHPSAVFASVFAVSLADSPFTNHASQCGHSTVGESLAKTVWRHFLCSQEPRIPREPSLLRLLRVPTPYACTNRMPYSWRSLSSQGTAALRSNVSSVTEMILLACIACGARHFGHEAICSADGMKPSATTFTKVPHLQRHNATVLAMTASSATDQGTQP